jgi:hypothetical protein
MIIFRKELINNTFQFILHQQDCQMRKNRHLVYACFILLQLIQDLLNIHNEMDWCMLLTLGH